eukprot:15358176-Ditylum_brightwellii.AAC.1
MRRSGPEIPSHYVPYYVMKEDLMHHDLCQQREGFMHMLYLPAQGVFQLNFQDSSEVPTPFGAINVKSRNSGQVRKLYMLYTMKLSHNCGNQHHDII